LPIVDVDKSRIQLIDKDSAAVTFETKLDTYQNQLEIYFEKSESNSYYMTLYPESVTDFFGATNDTINFKLRTKSKADFSLLDLSVSNLDRYPAIVQLVDEDENVEKSVILNNTNKHTFEYITPGKYFVKVIYDDNENGVWDTGDYLKNRQPEEVKYAEIKNELRANWDVIESVNLK